MAKKSSKSAGNSCEVFVIVKVVPKKAAKSNIGTFLGVIWNMAWDDGATTKSAKNPRALNVDLEKSLGCWGGMKHLVDFRIVALPLGTTETVARNLLDAESAALDRDTFAVSLHRMSVALSNSGNPGAPCVVSP